MKFIIALTIFILTWPATTFAAIDPALKECLQRGYEQTFRDGVIYCVLPDKSQCAVENFNNGTCGAQYKNADYCVAEGRPVWDSDKCCAGTEAYLRPNFMGQPSCVKISSAQKIYDQIRYNPLVWIGGIGIALVLAIFFKISKTKKQ